MLDTAETIERKANRRFAGARGYAALWAECSVCGQPISWIGNGSPQPNVINLKAILESGWTVTDARIYCAMCKPHNVRMSDGGLKASD